MNEKEQKRQKRKAHVRRMKAIRILFWTVLFCVLIAGTGTLLAKYYAKESRKGVATASGLYFSSNYLENVPDGEEFPERLNTNHWDGQGSCQIEIEICNYSNILLYNDANLNITYDMYFQLIDEPGEGETYEIIYKEADENGSEAEKTITLTDTTTEHKIMGLYLPGGQANANKVILKITPKQESGSTRVENSYRSKRVKVWAIPTAPQYVADSFHLGAIISASPSKEAFTCTSDFEISEKFENQEWDNCKKIINAHSGFRYKIQTSGELDERYEGKSLVLTWNSDYLEIDMYNKYYLEAKKAGCYTEDAESNTCSIKMDLVSYLSMDFDFFKKVKKNDDGTTTGFDIEKITSVDEFKKLVKVSIE